MNTAIASLRVMSLYIPFGRPGETPPSFTTYAIRFELVERVTAMKNRSNGKVNTKKRLVSGTDPLHKIGWNPTEKTL